MRQAPKQTTKWQSNGEGHHVAELLSRLFMMIAMDQEDEPLADFMRKVEMEEEAVSDIFKKRPEDKARKEKCHKWDRRHRHAVHADKGKDDGPYGDEN